jgi:hypothetical protein
LSIDKQQDYKSLVKALEERFAPPNQTELYRVQLTLSDDKNQQKAYLNLVRQLED